MHIALMKAKVQALLTAELSNASQGQLAARDWTERCGANPLALPAILKTPQISLSPETPATAVRLTRRGLRWPTSRTRQA